jgi:hypothetical protein
MARKSGDDQLEDNRLIFDFLKHLTTLSTGSIVVIATLSDKIFAKLEHFRFECSEDLEF